MSSLPNRLSQHSPFSGWFEQTHALKMAGHFGGVGLPEKLIYLDHAAATPVDKRVLESMLPWMTGIYGNPANRLHPMGEIAEHGLAQARLQVAECIGVEFDELTFCSSATEANNLLLRGLIQHPLRKRNKIVISATEHSSIRSTVEALSNSGLVIQLLEVDAHGQINLLEAEKLIDNTTLAVCVMDVNNETGIIQKTLPAVAKIAHSHGALVHVDAVQGFARGNFHTTTTPFDTATLSGAKIYAGRGAAALVVRKRHPRVRLSAQLTGGGHEAGLRSGTPNLAAIVGLATGMQLQLQERNERLHYLSHLESIFSSALEGQIDVQIAGTQNDRVPGILMLSIPRVNAMKLIENARLLCVSTGSACKTLQATTSHVLKAMGYDEEEALSSFRISIGLNNTEDEMKRAADLIATTALELRRTSAV
jgi:cysteine desulfurase